MIVGRLHENTADPLVLTAFQSAGAKKKKKGSTVYAIGGIMDDIGRIVEQKLLRINSVHQLIQVFLLLECLQQNQLIYG